jgi:energy-coupling factor transport system ATP-binding protein
MVFQNPDNQIVATAVEEDVAFGPENLGVPPAEIRRRVDEALAIVGMSEFRRSAPHLLSGGQKQRVAIAGVLAMRPEALILDEPTAMLDPSGRREVLETVVRLNREEGITIVYITHFMEEAVRAGRVVVMDGGRLVLDGSPREVFARVAELRSLGLDVPQVTELALALRERGIDLPAGILTAEELVAELCRYESLT